MRKPAVVSCADKNAKPDLHDRSRKHADSPSGHDGGMFPNARRRSERKSLRRPLSCDRTNPLIQKAPNAPNAPNARKGGRSFSLAGAALDRAGNRVA